MMQADLPLPQEIDAYLVAGRNRQPRIVCFPASKLNSLLSLPDRILKRGQPHLNQVKIHSETTSIFLAAEAEKFLPNPQSH
jgi:hypothetical protein